MAHASIGSDSDVTFGLGWVHARRAGRGGLSGDVVWFEPGEKHWHGATATTAMTHIAFRNRWTERLSDWMEKVSEEQYKQR